MSNNIDIKTLEAFQDGNHKAFETVFIAYYNKTKAFIDGYIKSESDAEELTEDLFVNLWINHDSIDASKSFSSYLHTIARNSAINFLKHKYVHDTYLNSSQEIEYSSTSEEDLIAKELGLLIDDIVGKMSEQRKMIYTLSRQEGLSNAEIAIQLNTTKRKSVKPRIKGDTESYLVLFIIFFIKTSTFSLSFLSSDCIYSKYSKNGKE